MKFSTSAPSNIALVKYWGKYGNQLPANCSLSYTLTHCQTQMEIELLPIDNNSERIEVYFEGQKNDKFVGKISQFFKKIEKEYPIVNQYHWKISSQNTFPHSSGIASSASSMCALTQALVYFQHNSNDLKEISRIARIGSGSASRSAYKGLAWWGKHPMLSGSSQEYAIETNENIDPIFLDYADTILIASSGEKSVSSSLGHELMNNHIYRDVRYAQANQNAYDLLGAMRCGDIERFGEIVEQEALTLHALMMMSSPSFILLKPNTLRMIEAIRSYRAQTNEPVYFTLDAGPNIHLLYPTSIEKNTLKWIDTELKPLCENGFYIKDYASKPQ